MIYCGSWVSLSVLGFQERKFSFPMLQVKGQSPAGQQDRLKTHKTPLANLRVRVGNPREGEKQEAERKKEETLDLKALS